jgi:Mrp family chromosome partitioning ATPase
VRLASTLSTSTSFAALDEPCRHLDPEHIEALNVVLEQRMNGGMQLGVCDSRRLLKSSLFQKEDTSAQEDCVLDVGVAKAGEGEKLRIEIPVPFLLSATGRAVRRQPVEIAAGSLVVVRGTNGSGKTSLIEALANAASRAGRKVGISRQEPEQQVFASTPAIEFSEVSAAHEGSLWSKGG